MVVDGRSHHKERAPQSLGSPAELSLPQVTTWLRKKNLVALEEGWRDPATLQALLCKQRNLQAELDTSLHQQQELQQVRTAQSWQLCLSHSGDSSS